MRKFGKSLLFFAVPLLLINTCFYIIIERLYQQPYSRHPPLNDFRTFVFADSHGEPIQRNLERYGIYNFSKASDSYSDMLRKLFFLTKNRMVDRIIITADDHTLSSYRDEANNNDRSIHLVNFGDLKKIDESMKLSEYIKEKYLLYYIVLLNSKSKSFLTSYFKGFLNSFETKLQFSGDWSKRGDKIKSSQRRAKAQFDPVSQSKELKQSLLGIINLCKQHNIELVGIRFPLSKDYLNAIGNRSSKADSVLKINDIKILDFKTIFIQSDSLFSNQDHLNQEGGRILSDRIKDVLICL